MSRLVTVASFGSATELMLARTQLTAAGIETFVPDELALATADYLAPGLGGFRLAVPEHRVEEARAMLDHPGDEDPHDDDETGMRCAACGSAYVVLERSAWARGLSLLFFGLFRRWEHPRWRCRRCGSEGEETPAPDPEHPYREPITRRGRSARARSDREPR